MKRSIEIDISGALKTIADVSALLQLNKRGVFEGVRNDRLNHILALLQSGSLEVGISGCGLAPVTGNRVIRLGIVGDFKECAAAVLALKGDCVCAHV